jgi:hypothetical protein
MDTQKIHILLDALGGQMLDESKTHDVLSMLVKETIKFRDKIKEERGVVLTVADTRQALDGLEKYLKGEDWNQNLTGEQAALLQIWIDRITIFNK